MSEHFPEDLRRAIDSTVQNNRPQKTVVPRGWEPRLDVEEGVLCYTSNKPIENHDWAALIEHFGFKPELFTIDPSTLRASAWDGWTHDNDGNAVPAVLHAYKADIVPREQSHLELECVHKRLKRIKARPAQDRVADSSFVFVVADSQIGKRDSYTGESKDIDGVNRTLDRLAQLPALFDAAYGGEDEIVLAFPGDNIEQCGGHYSNQPFMTTLNIVEQRELCADAFDVLINHAASKGRNVIVAAVGGNHGENRNTKGKKITDEGDNDDVAIFRSLRRAYEKSEKYPNIDWRVPHRELDQTFETAGTYIALTHGHLFKNSRSAFEWWQGQMTGRLPAGDAHVLLSGHWHSLKYEEPTQNRTWIQAPALEAGSHYFRDGAGLWFPTGSVLGFSTSHGEVHALRHIKTP